MRHETNPCVRKLFHGSCNLRNITECPDGRTSAYRPKAHRVGEDGRGAMTRLERRGGVATAFMAAALWIMLLIAGAILAETDRCLITSRTLPQSRI